MNTNKYLIKNMINPTVLKNFLLAYGAKKKQIRIFKRKTVTVAVADIVDIEHHDWKKMVRYYAGIFDRMDRGAELSGSALWQHEYSNALSVNKRIVQRRMGELRSLYFSIKKNGFKRIPNDLVMLFDIGPLPPPIPEYRTSRFSKKFFRLTGMRRCLVCNHHKIKKIPARVLSVRFIQL